MICILLLSVNSSTRMRPISHYLLTFWEIVQVELHGRYSGERVLELAKYTSETKWSHAILVIVGTPLPCLIVMVLIDFLPLADPYEGITANKMFFAREFYNFVVFTFAAIYQLRVAVPILFYSMWRAMRNAVIVAVVTVSTIYGLACTIGFPIPFLNLTISTVWLSLVGLCIVSEWAEDIREKPAVRRMIIDVIRLWMCITSLAFIYPVYYYVFITLSHCFQVMLTMLLPIIKLAMRNLLAKTAAHLRDETPEIVVFNAELFSSLFLSYCMQRSPSLWTTTLLMMADIVLAVASVRDIDDVYRGVKFSEHIVRHELKTRTRVLSTENRLSILHQANSILIKRKRTINSNGVSPFTKDMAAIAPARIDRLNKKISIVIKLKKLVPKRSRSKLIAAQSSTAGHSRKRNMSGQGPATLEYTRKVQRLLYMAEFLILLNYIEVIIPLIFSSYLVITYNLPNREYYAVFKGMEQQQLIQTLKNVMLYCFLQFVSLVSLTLVIRAKIGLSLTRQLAFVLVKQFDWVQTSLIFWVLYNAQSSLEHVGYDYSFQFTWLHTHTSSISNVTETS